MSLPERRNPAENTLASPTFVEKNLQTKNCSGSATMGVMKLFLAFYIHQQSCLWTPHPLGKVEPAHPESWLTLPVKPGSQECNVKLLCLSSDTPLPTVHRAFPVMGSTLLKEGSVQPHHFLSQFLWLSAGLYHLLCMVAIRSNCSCMVHTELALKVTAASMRLVMIWPVWRVNTLTVYWGFHSDLMWSKGWAWTVLYCCDNHSNLHVAHQKTRFDLYEF